MNQYVLSLSYGKDSLACLGAIEKLGWPLDRIVHAEIWATDTIPADLPPMLEFKQRADAIIKERWGIEVEHVCAIQKDGTKQTYEKIFYRTPKRKLGGKFKDGTPAGFPYTKGAWCNDRLKTNPLDAISHTPPPRTDLRVPHAEGKLVQFRPQESSYSTTPSTITGFANRWRQYCTGELKKDAIKALVSQGADKNTVVQYLGIASDEPVRLERLDGITKISPLAAIGWTEADARKWCEENDLLSPIYTTATRGGCWFCHNQGIDQLRLLRRNYPDLWALLLKWDIDSPVSFHPDGRTVHDFDRRFQLEDEGKVPVGRKFRWKMMEEADMKETQRTSLGGSSV